MQDVELFLSQAEIAGVFVGFGALIAVRSGSAAEADAISYIRWVLASGVWVVVAALAPIVVSLYGISGHALARLQPRRAGPLRGDDGPDRNDSREPG